MKSICLIGFMGSGKSTIGKSLAKSLDMNFFDTDEEIKHWRKCDIPSIFEKEGEKAFREYEKKILQKMPNENAVIATGGGIIENIENRITLKSNFFVIHLNPTFYEIQDRLKDDISRPLWNQNIEAKRNLYNKRKALYVDCADLVIDIHEQQIEVTLKHILESIKPLLFGNTI